MFRNCNLFSVQAYTKFKDLLSLPLQPASNSISRVQGSPVHVLGTIVLCLSLAHNVPPFEAKFYVTSDFVLNSDGPLGFD